MSMKHSLLQFFKRNFPGFVILTVIVACGVTFANRSHRKSPEVFVPAPSDVDLVLKNYRYSEHLPTGSFSLHGTELVRRGAMMLGLRSNFKKTTTLTDITGRFHGTESELEFSAAQAEWETSRDAPLLLQSGVTMRLGGATLPDVERATIDLKQGRVTTFGLKRKTYALK